MGRTMTSLDEVPFNTGSPDTHDTQGTHGHICDHPPGDPRESAYAVFLAELESGILSSLPLAQFVCCAARHNLILFEQAEGWCGLIWHFTRIMKLHPDVADLDADDAFKRICHASEPFGGLEYVLELASDDLTEIQFVTSWDKIRFRPGLSPLQNAAAEADAQPLCPKRCEGGRNALYGRFVSIAGWLQVLMGNRNILLPIDLLAETLGCDRSRVSQLRQLACRDGFLQEVAAHEYRPGGKGRATEFRFDLTRFGILMERSRCERRR